VVYPARQSHSQGKRSPREQKEEKETEEEKEKMMLPWNERVAAISINPDMASREDVARMAAELMDAMQMVERKEAHRFMLPHEYFDTEIEGWHEVRKTKDGYIELRERPTPPPPAHAQ
jgi:hypothetical protein